MDNNPGHRCLHWIGWPHCIFIAVMLVVLAFFSFGKPVSCNNSRIDRRSRAKFPASRAPSVESQSPD